MILLLLLICEADILGSLLPLYIVVRVKSFESVFPDHWLDSEMSLFTGVNSSETIFINTLCNPKIRFGCQKHCVKISQ